MSVAIVDIGSNSIKVLVAERESNGRVVALLSKTLDARISAGISAQHPRLTSESMERGLAAIQELLRSAAPFQPAHIQMVATSAVRDAENGNEFRERVRAATGHEIRILSGDEEANLIGRGLTCDPTLARLQDFYVFDLGGGSLEALAFRHRSIEEAVSLQLGCVRLTERFVPDMSQPLPPSTVSAVHDYTQRTLNDGGFRFALPGGSAAIGTGGTITTLRAILAARNGETLDQSDTRVALGSIRELSAELSAMSLEKRKTVAGLPPARADVYPVALATLVAVAEAGRFDAYIHSFYNLRYGLAAEALEGK